MTATNLHSPPLRLATAVPSIFPSVSSTPLSKPPPTLNSASGSSAPQLSNSSPAPIHLGPYPGASPGVTSPSFPFSSAPCPCTMLTSPLLPQPRCHRNPIFSCNVCHQARMASALLVVKSPTPHHLLATLVKTDTSSPESTTPPLSCQYSRLTSWP